MFKNNLGQPLTFRILRSIWQDVNLDLGTPDHFTRDEWLDNKRENAYYERLQAVEESGRDPFDGEINTDDIRYTLLDAIKRIAWNIKVGQFVYGLWHWFTDEPDYSSLYPYG